MCIKSCRCAAVAATILIAAVTCAWGEDEQNASTQAHLILEQSLNAYRAVQSYQDELEISFDVNTKDGGEDPFGMQEPQSIKLSFARPQRVALFGKGTALICDGVTQWTWYEQLNQCTEKPAEPWTFEGGVLSITGSITPSHPLFQILAQPDKNSKQIFDNVESISSVTPEERDGQAGQRIAGRMELPQPLMFEGAVPFTIWINDASHLIGEMRLDMTEFYNSMREMMGGAQGEDEGELGMSVPEFEKCEIVMMVRNPVLNAGIPDDRFVFKPGPDDLKVDDFEFGQDQSDQMELVGHPAPEFTGKDLDGTDVSLASLRGRVVVLDFWATWCGPCVMAMPHIQKLADHFADKPVTVLGMNRDAPGSEQRVKKLLERKKITFRQVMPNEEEDIGEKFRVQGIPCTVLIDAQGVIQDIRVGFAGEQDLIDDIDSLLDGKSLFDPEQVKPLTDSTAKDATTTDPAPGPGQLIDIGELRASDAQRLVELDRTAGQFWGYNIKQLDADGDGTLEYVMPDAQNRGIDVLSADGASLRRVRLAGLRSGSSIQQIERVTVNGQPHWFVVSARYSMSGQSTVQASLHADDGAALWTVKPPVPDKHMVQGVAAAGDLDGDGSAEFILGLTATKLNPRDSRAPMPVFGSGKAWLMVLDRNGQLLSSRLIGKSLQAIMVTPASSADAPGTILCFGDSRLWRMRYQPGSGPEPASATPVETTNP